MFLVTPPSGPTQEYVYTLVPGELYNNSFDAISPNSQWMVAGEWGTMTHLQVYPTPYLNASTGTSGGSLALAGYIQLDHPVNDVQGCDFVTATELICSSWCTSTSRADRGADPQGSQRSHAPWLSAWAMGAPSRARTHI
jgi:hypothetical protein